MKNDILTDQALLVFRASCLGDCTRVFDQYYAGKAKKEKTKRKAATASLDHQLKVLKDDNVIAADFNSRRAAAKAEVEAGRPPTVFNDPNSMFKPPGDRD